MWLGFSSTDSKLQDIDIVTFIVNSNGKIVDVEVLLDFPTIFTNLSNQDSNSIVLVSAVIRICEIVS